MDIDTAEQIIAQVKACALQLAPNVRFVAKYGGEVFAMIPEDDAKFVGGVFASKGHVSVEFSNGADFADPEGLLEGKGKRRRHVKLHAPEDVGAKQLRGFLEQALRP